MAARTLPQLVPDRHIDAVGLYGLSVINCRQSEWESLSFDERAALIIKGLRRIRESRRALGCSTAPAYSHC